MVYEGEGANHKLRINLGNKPLLLGGLGGKVEIISLALSRSSVSIVLTNIVQTFEQPVVYDLQKQNPLSTQKNVYLQTKHHYT